MKVFAVNSSSGLEKSNTSLILDPFLEGLREAGAEVNLFYAAKLKIKFCCGQFHCWFDTPGKCPFQDDMQMLYPYMREANYWVLATPLYADAMNAPMKMIIDRVLPLAEPYIEKRDGHCRHPLREGTKRGGVVLISNCGFTEGDNFDPLVAHIKAFCKNLNREFSGALLRPAGPALRYGLEVKNPIITARSLEVVEAARAAGHDLAKVGKIGHDKEATVAQSLIPGFLYRRTLNKIFKKRVAEAEEKIRNRAK